MAYLSIETGIRKGSEHPLGATPVSLGREPECEICVPDRMASRKHVQLTPEGDRWVAQDLQSRNGTLLNNMPLTRATLADGDELLVGTTVVRFHAQGKPTSGPIALTEAQRARGHRDTVAAPSGIMATRPAPDGPKRS